MNDGLTRKHESLSSTEQATEVKPNIIGMYPFYWPAFSSSKSTVSYIKPETSLQELLPYMYTSCIFEDLYVI